MQAEGAAPLVEQAKQQERGPRQRGVSHGQVLAVAAIVPAPRVSTRPGDAPEWETSQFGSRLDPASFNITTSYLIMTELN